MDSILLFCQFSIKTKKTINIIGPNKTYVVLELIIFKLF